MSAPVRRYCSLVMLVLLPVVTLHAQQPAAVELKNPDLWGHRLGPNTAVHLTQPELDEARGSRAFFFQNYVEFEVVVSENGTVESATFVGPTRLHLDEAHDIEMARTFKPWTQDGKTLRVRIHDYVNLLPPEEWAETHIPFPEIRDLSAVQIDLKRTRCYGTCPAYTVTISGDGTIHYNGQGSVFIPGQHTAHISPDAVRELLRQFRKADFFSAKDEYASMVTDNPTQTISLTIGTHTKTVVDYVGTEAGLPLAIHNLEDQIDDTADTKRWIKSDDRTLPSLLEEKWPFQAFTKQNLMLYASAIENKNGTLVEHYLRSGGPILAPSGNEASPVCVASATGDLDLVKRMTEQTKTFPPIVMNQCLSSAARSGNLALLQFWLDHGADPKVKPEKVESDWMSDLGPLPNALVSGKADVVRKLLDYKLDVHSNITEDEPPIIWALERGNGKEVGEIITALAVAGADVNARGNMGETPIFSAHFRPEAIKPLLAAGADIEARDNNGNTPLIRYGFMEPMVRELLADGADPTAVAKNGDTALKTARQYGCPTCATLIETAVKQRATASTN